MDYLIKSIVLHENFSKFDYHNIVNDTRADSRWLSRDVEIVITTAYLFIICVGLFLNACICYVVLKKKTMRTARNLFIVNLAVSDMVMCVFCMPFTLVKLLMKDWVLGDVVCRTVPWLQATNVFASTITITAIALDRYHVILSPCSVKVRMRKFVLGSTMMMIWLSSSVVGLPLIVYGKIVHQSYAGILNYTFCVEEWPSRESRYAYATAVLSLQFLLPLVLLFGLHWRISSFLRSRIRQNPRTAAEISRTLKESQRHRKNSMLLMAIAVMYALCWFPLTIINFLADFNRDLFMERHFLVAFATAHLVAMSSAVANPIVYGWFNSNFKREFVSFMRIWQKMSSSREETAGPSDKSRLAGPGLRQAVGQALPSYNSIQADVQPCHKPRLNRKSTD